MTGSQRFYVRLAMVTSVQPAHPGQAMSVSSIRAADPIAVLPVSFRLLRYHELTTSLSAPLHPDTVVTLATAGR
jgi:hypothetical protein